MKEVVDFTIGHKIYLVKKLAYNFQNICIRNKIIKGTSPKFVNEKCNLLFFHQLLKTTLLLILFQQMMLL
jgi:hypothetical protein